MIEIVGVPFDKCGKYPGSALGPHGIRFAELERTLAEFGFHIPPDRDVDLAWASPKSDSRGLKAFGEALEVYKALKAHVGGILAKTDTIPLVLGGDHSISIGSMAAAVEHYGEELGVLWIDAHADINSATSSPSGNIHGMPLGALTERPAEGEGVKVEQWNQLLSEVVSKRLDPSHIAWIGLREVDEGEADYIYKCTGSFPTTMQDLDEVGLQRIMVGLKKWIEKRGIKHLWISFDVDVLDPVLAPGTGTTVRGGLTYREGHHLAENLSEMVFGDHKCVNLAGMDIVEVNPLRDINNVTAREAVEWLASLLGKRILRTRPDVDL